MWARDKMFRCKMEFAEPRALFSSFSLLHLHLVIRYSIGHACHEFTNAGILNDTSSEGKRGGYKREHKWYKKRNLEKGRETCLSCIRICTLTEMNQKSDNTRFSLSYRIWNINRRFILPSKVPMIVRVGKQKQWAPL